MADPDKLEPDEPNGEKDIDEDAHPEIVVPTGLPDEVDELEPGDEDEAPNE